MAVDRRQIGRAPGPTSQSGLADLIDRILDKGLVIDAWVRISLVGIELITIEARVVVASVDTYLKYAEAIAQTALAAEPQNGFRRQQIPSDDEVATYLKDHPEGTSYADIERFFGISRDELDPIIQRLTSGPRVRRDERQRDRLFALGRSSSDNQRQLESGRGQEDDRGKQSESDQERSEERKPHSESGKSRSSERKQEANE